MLLNVAAPQEVNGCLNEGYQSIDGGQNCYKLVSKTIKSWDNAQSECKNDGGNLVSIRDGFEQAYISLIKFGSVNHEWIGLRSVSIAFKLFKYFNIEKIN